MPDPATIEKTLAEAFPSGTVRAFDTTGTGDHFRVEIASAVFQGKTLVEQHRLVYDALAGQLADGSIHALSIKTSAP